MENLDRAYDAICEAVGRGNTASAVVLELVGRGDLASLSQLATMIRTRSRGVESERARMQVLRTITSRACKKLECEKLGYKLDKATNSYACYYMVVVEKVEKDAVLEALELVISNLNREDVMRRLGDAFQGRVVI